MMFVVWFVFGYKRLLIGFLARTHLPLRFSNTDMLRHIDVFLLSHFLKSYGGLHIGSEPGNVDQLR